MVPSEPDARLLPWRSRRPRDSGASLSPAVRRILAARGLDAGSVTGTGEGGRITRADALSARSPEAQRVPFDRLRRRAAQALVRSKATAPHAFTSVACDYTAVARAREAAKNDWRAREGFGLTYLPFVARAVVDALRAFPTINATVTDAAVTVHDAVNLGIAVDLDYQGLIVPVIHDAETLRLVGIARAIVDRSRRAHDRALTPDDVSGGTFTITNPGAAGTYLSVPIINLPQVAIVCTDGVRKTVIAASDGRLAVRAVGHIGCSFDHRVVDDAYVGAFLDRVRTMIEKHHWPDELR